ncbi:chitin synthase-domain-containing protein [Suillus subluteus]|nr:chitin synthase-domain-containing protein [Suillus subluteus]
MSPLKLEIYHQMRNVIGIDPAFYEYIFTVDADTQVTHKSLNQLVVSAADHSSIIGKFTPLTSTAAQADNEYRSFESLFSSVSCLPGYFLLYHIHTADKGHPIIISNHIIDEYAEGNIDTLHKKNLFSLGEDCFLTMLLLKHFPMLKTKFIMDEVAHTMTPESWRVLFSQRRWWINSTIHNLCELVVLPELCSFCCVSMRFFIFIDLLGTIGLQALIFIIKHEFMLVGWMVVYLLLYTVYSFFLPIYLFWCMDDFSWGNMHIVIGDRGNKKVVMKEDEHFDKLMITLKKFSNYEADTWENGPHRSDETELPTSLTVLPPTSAMHSLPQMPFMSFSGGAGSVHGSDYGHMPMIAPPGYQHSGSVYGVMPQNLRGPMMMNMPMMTGGSQTGSFGMLPAIGGDARPLLMFSMVTSVNPFAGLSFNPNPTDDDLFNSLQNYLSTQDLMTVMKKYVAHCGFTIRY